MREEIPNALDGERVDRVAALMTGLSRSAIARLISDGKVTRNEERVVDGSGRVTEGDYVAVEMPIEEELTKALAPDESVQFEVVYEDEALIVVNKPIGLVVHPGAGNIGGGGFMVIRLSDGRVTTIDFREVAPSGAYRDMFFPIFPASALKDSISNSAILKPNEKINIKSLFFTIIINIWY